MPAEAEPLFSWICRFLADCAFRNSAAVLNLRVALRHEL
jgi:hypothetical protein